MSDDVQLMYGGHSFKNGSSKVAVFAFPNRDLRVFPSAVLMGASRTGHVLAARDGCSSNGGWYARTLISKEGFILGVQLNVTFNRSPYTSCMLLLRLRKEASLIQVNANLSKDVNAVYDTLPAFMGRADVITVDEAESSGVSFNKYVKRNMFDEEELEEEFEIVTISKGKPRPRTVVMKTTSGKNKEVEVEQEPRRRIRVRAK